MLLGGLGGIVAYTIKEISSDNQPTISQKMCSVPEFNELDDEALKVLLENASVITTNSSSIELDVFRKGLLEANPKNFAPLFRGEEL